jgi:hypothetical protein
MPHTKSRMAALLDIAFRTAEAKDQKITQPLFGAREIVLRVYRPEDIVARDLPVKSRDEAPKTIFPKYGKHLVFLHQADANIRLLFRLLLCGFQVLAIFRFQFKFNADLRHLQNKDLLLHIDIE